MRSLRAWETSNHREVPVLPAMDLGYPGTGLRRTLVDAVLRGEKTATSSLRDEYEPFGDDPLPSVGDRWLLRGFADEPVAIVETTEVHVLRVRDVEFAFARDEGEGFETVEHWRAAHERFWAGREVGDDMFLVTERFRVVERLAP